MCKNDQILKFRSLIWATKKRVTKFSKSHVCDCVTLAKAKLPFNTKYFFCTYLAGISLVLWWTVQYKGFHTFTKKQSFQLVLIKFFKIFKSCLLSNLQIIMGNKPENEKKVPINIPNIHFIFLRHSMKDLFNAQQHSTLTRYKKKKPFKTGTAKTIFKYFGRINRNRQTQQVSHVKIQNSC